MSYSINEKTFALFANPGNQKIIRELEKARAQIVKFPPLDAEKIESNADSIEQLNRLAEFDWIIFPDVLTVDFFLESLEENQIDVFELDQTRVCAFGETVSDRLRFAQLHADVIPKTVRANDVTSALKDYIAAENFGGLKFLLPKERGFAGEIKNELLEADARIFELPVYQIKVPPGSEISKLKALVKGGAIDEFIFSAPTDFIYLNRIFDGESLAEVFGGVEIIAADANAYQTARENGLKCSGLFQSGKIAKVEK